MKTEKRHFKKWSKTQAPGSEKRTLPSSLKLLLVVLWLILMGGISHSVVAQTCTLTCKAPTEINPDPFSIGSNCEGVIDLNTVLQAQEFCPNGKELFVRSGSDLLGQDYNEITLDLSAHIGQTLAVTTIDTASGVFCVTYLEVLDTQSPDFVDCASGVDTVIACTGDTSVAAIGIPAFTDNCAGNIDLSYTEDVMMADCNSVSIETITRTWTVRDASLNSASCTQTITIRRPDITDVVFPDDVILSCENPIGIPDSVGYPTIDDLRVTTSSNCDLVVTFEDDTLTTPNNDEVLTVERTWLVLRKCDGATEQDVQTISVKDKIDPEITCPDPFTISTLPGECTAVLIPPVPVVSDNCDPNPQAFVVNTSFGRSNGLKAVGDVPLGSHSIMYRVIDASMNTADCITSFQVIDDELPTAVCDDEVIVSLQDGGVALARAQTFDEGSVDNCVPNLFFKARRMELGTCDGLNGDDDFSTTESDEWFDDFVFFCCEDMAEDTVRVIMRAFIKDPGPGAVDPDRYLPGNDLYRTYNECMVRVTLQDKIGPKLTCPAPDTIICAESAPDYSIFGSPIVDEGCDYTLDSIEVAELNDCGAGMIIRTFTATDGNGNSGSCTQTIIVENPYSLVDTMITWPKDIDTTICGGDFLPENLPEGFNEPSIEFDACAKNLFGFSYSDTRFDINYPACFKIIRRWTVIDWCAYNEDSRTGRFSQNQIIKVQDVEDPIIECITDITVGINNGTCNSALVSLPIVTATDMCSPTVRVTNNSPYANSNSGGDASGTYPIGETSITFTASDACGNFVECSATVTVVDDKAPAPICVEGLVATLHNNGSDGISATVMAETFLASSTFDACHPRDEITLSIRKAIDNPTGPPTGNTELQFSCDETGNQFIELWVTDTNGNSDYCVTYVDVQDNSGVCPLGTVQGFIAGNIITDAGAEVEEVVVSVMNSQPVATTTGVDGVFKIDGLSYGDQFTLVPSKDDDILNGVTTMDAILISKHILGLNIISSPYRLIAADIDASGNISTIDLIRLRKLILNKDIGLPNGNTSWRFIDADFEFPEGVNPLRSGFPELKKVEDFSTATGSVAFIGVKVGDINGTVRPNSIMQGESRSTNGDVVLRVKDRAFESGETFSIDVTSEDLFNLIGFQFTLDYDTRLVELVDLEVGDLPKLDRENFGIIDLEQGLITASWYEQNNVLTVDEGTLMRLTFRAIRSGDLFSALELKSLPTLAEAYNYNEDPMQVLLQFVEGEGLTVNQSEFRLYQNHPNPFYGNTKIGFVLPKKTEAALRIYSVSGKLVYQSQNTYGQGYNEIELSNSILPVHGIYYYRLETDEHSATRKMIFSVSN